MAVDQHTLADLVRVDPDSRPLALRRATELLDAVNRAEDAREVRDQAKAMEVYYALRKDGREASLLANEIVLVAERRIGQLLGPPASAAERGEKGGRGNKSWDTTRPAFPDVDPASRRAARREAERARLIASLPEERFHAALDQARDAGEPLSPAGLAAEVKREAKDAVREERRSANRAKVEAAPPFAVSVARYATIVADPPWSPVAAGVVDVCGRSNPEYATMDVDQIESLDVDGTPVSELADADAHLYLWVVNRTVAAGFRVMEAWGFRYVTMLTWCKPSIGMGNYFRNNTEHVMFGVRGQQRLKRADVGTWFAAARGPGGHSSKPSEFYDLVDSCSPGPVLELFGRRPRAGWTIWGEGL